jgi:two-component system, response regulator PdtaR
VNPDPDPTVPAAEGSAATRILVAEDEVISRMDLREMLENLGYVVVAEAGDGVAAINLAREVRPDLVLMDIKMPELDGIEAASAMSQEQLAPVLLLTAYSDRDFVDRAIEAGVMGYLVKPFAEAQLKPAIDVALERWREVRQMQQDLAQTQETLETRKLVERAKGVLMDSQNLKEAEAFRRIQRLSMNSRKSMREVAEAILLAHEAGRSL